MKTKTKNELQSIISNYINGVLKDNNIEKSIIAKKIEVSNVFITLITKEKGNLPTPARLWQIVKVLKEDYKIYGADKDIDRILKDEMYKEYKLNYIIAKLDDVYNSMGRSVIQYLENEYKQIKEKEAFID